MWAAAALQAAGSAGGLFSKNARWLVPLIALLLLYYFWGQYALKRLLGNVPDDTTYNIGGGDVSTAFYNTRSSIAQNLYKALKSSSLTSDIRCAALTKANGYNDNQLILIHNFYKNKYGATLYDMLSEVLGDDCGFYDIVNPFGQNVKLSERLTRLGLV